MKKFITTSVLAMGLMLPMTVTSTLRAEPFERHPEIREAIHSLEKAKEHLRHADHDFGGHREAALAACDNAINQLKLALESDRH